MGRTIFNYSYLEKQVIIEEQFAVITELSLPFNLFLFLPQFSSELLSAGRFSSKCRYTPQLFNSKLGLWIGLWIS
jgi:hypothetical protein